LGHAGRWLCPGFSLDAAEAGEEEFGDRAVEMQLHVAGAFELFEDEVIHAAFGFDEGGAEDGETAAFFGVTRAFEEFRGLGKRNWGSVLCQVAFPFIFML
jgi:hypothetical protein